MHSPGAMSNASPVASWAARSARFVRSAHTTASGPTNASRSLPSNLKTLTLQSITALTVTRGYVHPDTPSRVIDLAEVRRRQAEAERKEREHDQQRTASALKLWDQRKPFRGSPAETYLRDTRGIGDWLEAFDLDESLGFHPDCPFEGQRLPCMVALVRNIHTDAPQAIHRTALRLGPRPERIDRRSYAPVKGGAVKLSLDGDVTHGLLIGEGIETTLSASRALKFRPCWSVISKSGIADFPALGGLESVTIAVDRDEDGGAQKAAGKCVERLTAADIEVVTTHSPVGKDFNDLLIGGAR
jgi:hypothetical protein